MNSDSKSASGGPTPPPRSPTAPAALRGALTLGPIPRVVGTLSSLPDHPTAIGNHVASDLVELRIDQMPPDSDWLAVGREFEAAGVPVIVTPRAQSEGGKWSGPETERLALYRQAVQHLSAVDVELRSPIAAEVFRAAQQRGKTCILSYHDFEKTPGLAELESVISKAEHAASVVKVTTMVRVEADIENLRGLLATKRRVPLCVMGMGALGTPTRVAFPALGSCLTYGYLDRPSAPGQLSAAELVRQLRAQLPEYDRDYLARKHG
jgi:3-dehydroquinate dehydratase-1